MYNGKSILAIVPARGGSKGVPRKNIRQMGTQPLMAWSIQAGLRSKYVDRVIVSTEDEEISRVSKDYKAEVPFLRPMDLALDHSPSTDAILYTIDELYRREGVEYDYLLLLQPTSPLRNENHIDNAIEILLESNNDSLISITELEHPVYWNRYIHNNMLSPFIEYDKSEKYRRQDFEKIYRLNGAIYLIKIDTFLESKSFETSNTLPYIMDNKSSIDIDTMDDFEIAEFYIKGNLNN